MSIARNPLRILVVLGPTASGKSDLAVKLAKKFDGEIISADSRQIYRELDIGSGKVPKDKSQIKIQNKHYFYKEVRHHLLDVANPRRIFTVSHYQKLAEKALHDIQRRDKLPIICGGTGLYIDALIYGYTFPEVKPNFVLRKKLEKLSPQKLYQDLYARDPRRAQNIDKHNKRRLIRALEIAYAIGKTNPLIKKPLHNVIKIGIAPLKNTLKEKIKKRLYDRIQHGMIQEVKKLLAVGVSWKRLDALGLEYRYVSRYLRGLISKKAMISKLEKEIWHYAKRQMTWFRKDKDIHWAESAAKAYKKTVKILSKKSK